MIRIDISRGGGGGGAASEVASIVSVSHATAESHVFSLGEETISGIPKTVKFWKRFFHRYGRLRKFRSGKSRGRSGVTIVRTYM